jgi:hypothetical protein
MALTSTYSTGIVVRCFVGITANSVEFVVNRQVKHKEDWFV